jgi:hypothetical protein
MDQTEWTTFLTQGGIASTRWKQLGTEKCLNNSMQADDFNGARIGAEYLPQNTKTLWPTWHLNLFCCY